MAFSGCQLDWQGKIIWLSAMQHYHVWFVLISFIIYKVIKKLLMLAKDYSSCVKGQHFRTVYCPVIQTDFLPNYVCIRLNFIKMPKFDYFWPTKKKKTVHMV